MKIVTDRNALLPQSNHQILPGIFILIASNTAGLHWHHSHLLFHSHHFCFPCCSFIDYICLILDSLSSLSHSLWFYKSLFVFSLCSDDSSLHTFITEFLWMLLKEFCNQLWENIDFSRTQYQCSYQYLSCLAHKINFPPQGETRSKCSPNHADTVLISLELSGSRITLWQWMLWT